MMDCLLPICNVFLFYYIYIVFDLSFTQIIRIKIGQVIILRYFHKIRKRNRGQCCVHIKYRSTGSAHWLVACTRLQSDSGLDHIIDILRRYS